MHCDVEFFQGREDWLPKRGLGGSDAAAILGLDKYCPPLQLWAEMTGKVERQEGPELARRAGAQVEPLVLELLEENSGEKIWQPGKRKNQICQLRSKERPWQTYTPDGLLLDGDSPKWAHVNGIAEAKHTSIEDAWEHRSSHGAARAECQIHHGFTVLGDTGAHAIMGALVTNRTFVMYHVDYDPDVADFLLETEHQFLELVQQDIPPGPHFMSSSSDVYGRLLPFAQADVVVFTEGSEGARLADELRQASEQRLLIQKQEAALKEQFQHKVLEAAGIGSEELEGKGLRIETPHQNWNWTTSERAGYTVEPKTITVMRKVK